jgi:mono/diheme cytochrome c family protein
MRTGVLRRVFRDSRSIVSDVRLWRDGQVIFKSQCARCHGESGLATDYPGTKSLAGIGNRHSDKEILHRTDLAGFVDLSSMDERSKRALTIFVAGL